MLFIQEFTVKYDKSRRSGEEMRRINDIRFKEISDVRPDFSAGEICFCKGICTRKPVKPAKAVPYQEHLRVSERVFLHKQDENYQIVYAHRPAQQFFKPVFTLGKNQYGRIVYNWRTSTFDSEWEYYRMIINFLDTEESAYRPKLFFRKEPDFLFEDLAWLRYCGKYHKRRITNAR